MRKGTTSFSSADALCLDARAMKVAPAMRVITIARKIARRQPARMPHGPISNLIAKVFRRPCSSCGLGGTGREDSTARGCDKVLGLVSLMALDNLQNPRASLHPYGPDWLGPRHRRQAPDSMSVLSPAESLCIHSYRILVSSRQPVCHHYPTKISCQ